MRYVILTLFILGCSSTSSETDVPEEAAQQTDQLESASPDILDDTEGPDNAETTSDLPAEETGNACEWPISVPEDPVDVTRDKFALALFHFNIQYVVGGLSYIDENGVEQVALPGCEGWDEQRVEDWIVTQTFEPVIDFYLAHPEFKADIEFGSVLLEVLAARHPHVIEKMRTVAMRGQVELISFHYSDQLFLAFPRTDIERSIARTKELFRQHCLPLSGVVFDQEGQAGLGRQDVLVKEGYTIGVYPKNLYRHQHGDKPVWPYYKWRGGDMIIAPGGVDPVSGIKVDWMFLDDGELLAASGGADPYFAPFAQFDPANIEKWLARNEEAKAKGYHVTHISEYVRHLKARGLEQPLAPPLLDGTWQPQSTRSILRWLGGRGVVWGDAEMDNVVRTGNAIARTDLILAETFAKWATNQGIDTGPVPQLLDEALKHLLLAEVTDATGINPWAGEVRYGIMHNEASRKLSAEAITKLKAAAGKPYALINSETGDVTLLVAPPLPETSEPLQNPPFEPEIRADGRTVNTRWLKDAKAQVIVEMEFSAAMGTPAANEDFRLIEVGFPRTEDMIRYSPGLLDDEVVEHAFNEFAWPDKEFFLPLGNGLIGLGNNMWLIKDTKSVHLAARIAPDDPMIRFRDETVPLSSGVTWRFAIVTGTASDALAVARALNVWPSGVR